MRILQICNKTPFYAKDGGSLAMYNLMRGMAMQGNEVTILSMNTSKHYVDPALLNEINLDGILPYTVFVNTSIRPLKLLFNLLFGRRPYNLTRFEDEGFRQKLVALLNTNTFDIVQLEGLYVCPFIKTIRQYSAAKIAYRSHNIESEIWKSNTIKSKSFLKRYYYSVISRRLKKYELSVINKYDYLVPISQIDLIFFQANGNSKPYITIPFGVDLAQYQLSTADKTGRMFYVGSLDWVPNIEGLTWFVQYVWRNIKKSQPSLKFIVAGRNAPRNLVKLFADNEVDFLGEIPDSKPLFLENDIMVVPLFAGSGMRVKIIEGLAYGKAIVTTEKGAEGIGYTDKVNLLVASNAESFIECIEYLVSNKNRISELGHHGRELIEEHYNNTTLSSQLVNFYKDNQA